MIDKKELHINPDNLTDGEIDEMIKLGILSEDKQLKEYVYPDLHLDRPPIDKRSLHAPEIINEAYNYQRPSSFSRALSFDLGGYRILLVSGTASVNEMGKPEHVGDFKAQTWRTYRNITNLLKAGGMTWHDVVRTTNYLRDMERDYAEFNRIRTSFFKWLGLDPLPASTGIQAILCWNTLLVEIEAYAVCKIK